MTHQNKSVNERGQKKVVTVLVFGTFDILHPGHLYFLREAKKHGEHLTVVVTPSRLVKQLKGKEPLFGERHRMTTVKLMSFVDEVVLGDSELSSFTILEKHEPDVVCIGHDQKMLEQYLKKHCAVTGQKIRFVRLKAYNSKKNKSEHLKKLLRGEEACLRCRI